MRSSLNGAALAREARRLVPALPVLPITGYAGPSDDREGFALLRKPFQTEDLLASLADMVKGGALTDAA